MLKPLIPLISDAWSHTFSETFHIMTVHAKYGKNHLSKELAASSTDNASSKNQNTLNAQEQVLVHVVPSESSYNFSLLNLNKNYGLLQPSILTSIFISKEGPPPKA